MDRTEVQTLLQKFKTGTASGEQRLLLENWYARESMLQMQNPELEDYVRIKQEMWAVLDRRVNGEHKVVNSRYHLRIWIGMAAAVAAVVFGVWFFSPSRRLDDRRDLMTYTSDLAPGKNGATITLGNGGVIQLSGEKKGVVIGRDGITYDDKTPLSPQGGSLPQGERGMMLTASTAKGQVYEFVLPDGTKVWLNADSKISFPSQFIGKERKILLSGEAYFAVVHNGKQPFRVESRGQVVEDIGTEFNINAYADEGSIKTTLVEGFASVTPLSPQGGSLPQGERDAGSVTLKPGEQAILTNNAVKVSLADIEDVTAWKAGMFRFSDEKLEVIMNQLSRWYNVDVVYADESVKQETFNGIITHFSNASKVLRMLEKTGQVHFKIEGKQIIVTK